MERCDSAHSHVDPGDLYLRKPRRTLWDYEDSLEFGDETDLDIALGTLQQDALYEDELYIKIEDDPLQFMNSMEYVFPTPPPQYTSTQYTHNLSRQSPQQMFCHTVSTSTSVVGFGITLESPVKTLVFDTNPLLPPQGYFMPPPPSFSQCSTFYAGHSDTLPAWTHAPESGKKRVTTKRKKPRAKSLQEEAPSKAEVKTEPLLEGSLVYNAVRMSSSLPVSSKRLKSEPDPGSEKQFVCMVNGCGKCFRRYEHLKRHSKSVHTSERREAFRLLKTYKAKNKAAFQCPVEACGRRFSRRDNLAQHIRVHGPDSLRTRKRRP